MNNIPCSFWCLESGLQWLQGLKPADLDWPVSPMDLSCLHYQRFWGDIEQMEAMPWEFIFKCKYQKMTIHQSSASSGKLIAQSWNLNKCILIWYCNTYGAKDSTWHRINTPHLPKNTHKISFELNSIQGKVRSMRGSYMGLSHDKGWSAEKSTGSNLSRKDVRRNRSHPLFAYYSSPKLNWSLPCFSLLGAKYHCLDICYTLKGPLSTP